MSQNFYLSGLSTIVNDISAASFFPIVNPVNFTDYSANAICRMKLSVAKNMFQFWSKSADLSQNSLADLVFRMVYDPSSGLVPNNDASSNPMSLDFTLGSIVTWSDPLNVQINHFSNEQGNFQCLMPQDYLRFLAWVLFNNPNSTTNFLNGTTVETSFNNNAKSALSNTLARLTAYNYGQNNLNNQRQYTYNNYLVNPTTFLPNSNSTVDASSNPSSQIFQQIRTNAPSRIANINTTSEKIVDASTNTYPNGAWYKMPFQSGDSIYFILTANLPQGQSGVPSDKTGMVRKYRIRMLIMDDTALLAQTEDSNDNPINYGSFNVYPNSNSLIDYGYSYANDANNTKPPGP